MANIIVASKIYVVALRNNPEKNIAATDVLIEEDTEQYTQIFKELRLLIPYQDISNVFTLSALNNVLNENFRDYFDKTIDVSKENIYFIPDYENIKLMELKIISKQIEAVLGLNSDDFAIAVYFYCNNQYDDRVVIKDVLDA